MQIIALPGAHCSVIAREHAAGGTLTSSSCMAASEAACCCRTAAPPLPAGIFSSALWFCWETLVTPRATSCRTLPNSTRRAGDASVWTPCSTWRQQLC
jgi:hypothetical protein